MPVAGTGTLTPARFRLAGLSGLIIDWMRSGLETLYSDQIKRLSIH